VAPPARALFVTGIAMPNARIEATKKELRIDPPWDVMLLVRQPLDIIIQRGALKDYRTQWLASVN
jgi:hypothetical protein